MAQKKVRKGKKRWYPLVAPKVFNNQSLGETFVYETEQLPGKFVTTNLMTLTGNPKKQNMSAYFQITGVVEGVAQTKTIGLEMAHSSTRRLVRRGRSKVADSFLAKTKKGQLVRVKPIVMTRTRADGEVQSAIRQKTRQLLREAIAKYTFDTTVNDIVHMKLQKSLKDELSAIFPVRSVDIRYIKHTSPENEAEDDVEESQYVEKIKPVKEPTSSEGLASLKEELMIEDEDEE